MALTVEQYADLVSKIIKKKREIRNTLLKRGYGSAADGASEWYDKLIAFLDPERKDDGREFTGSNGYIDAYWGELQGNPGSDKMGAMQTLEREYQSVFSSGDVDKTLEAVQTLFGLEVGSELEAESEPEADAYQTDKETYGFAATSDENKKIIMDELLGIRTRPSIANRPFDPMNREDVLRLFRRNDEGKYEPAFPAAKDPGFKGLTEAQAVKVLKPENGFLYYPAGNNSGPVIYSEGSWMPWYSSKWNPKYGNAPSNTDVPDFADKDAPLFRMSKEALEEQEKRKTLEVELTEEKRSEKVLGFIFGSKLNHVGSDTYKTYDETWVSNIRKGSRDYSIVDRDVLSEDDVVALTILNLANPDITGNEIAGLKNVVTDKRRVTIDHLEMNLDTYLNRRSTNSSPFFLDPIVKAREETYLTLFNHKISAPDDPERYARMGGALAKGLPMLTGAMTAPVTLSGAVISRSSQAQRVQSMIDRHPEILEAARKEADRLGTRGEFERALRKCRTVSKLYDYGKKTTEDALRLSKHQAGLLYDSEGQKIELTTKEEETLQIEAAKRDVLQKMLHDYSIQLNASVLSLARKEQQEIVRFQQSGTSEYLKEPIPEDKRDIVGRVISVGPNLEYEKKEVAPVLTLVLEHEGGMKAFEEILREAKDPQDSKEITKSLIDNGLIPPGNNGDPNFDYDRAIRLYGIRKQQKTDLETYGFSTSSEKSRKRILSHLLGIENDRVAAERPFDPLNREDVLRLFRRNENGAYEPAFPEAADPKFKGLTEAQTLEVLAPENGFLYYQAGDKKPSVFTKFNTCSDWKRSQWNPDQENNTAAPVFANGQNPRLDMSKESLGEEKKYKDLDVMRKGEKRAEDVYRFLFGSKLDHTGSDTYQTYDEKWVSTVKARGGTEYPVPLGKALPEDEVVALTVLNLADPEVTGKKLADLENPLKDNRLTTYNNFEMNLDTYLNRRKTNTAPQLIDPIVTARERTNSILTEYYSAAEDAPDRYEKMGATLARALPMLTSSMAFTHDLNGAILARFGVVRKVQNLFEAHPQLLEIAKQKAKESGTLDVFERSLRQCRALSALSEFGKKSIESEQRFARYQMGTLYDAEGQKIELTPKEADTLRIEAARRGIVAKMLLKSSVQQTLDSSPEELVQDIRDETTKMRETGVCKYTLYPIPEEKRELVLPLIGTTPFSSLDAQKKEMSPVLPLLFEHEGGMAVFDDILRRAKDPQNEEEITKALLDNKLIPAGTYGDPNFDYDTAIEAYSARYLGVKPKYQTFVDGIQGTGTSPLDRAYQRSHQHGSFYGGFIVSDDIKRQLQEQPISEFLHFEQGETAGEHYVTHKIPEMGRHEPQPGEAGPAVDYKLREYLNKVTKFAFRLNFTNSGDLKSRDDLVDDIIKIRSGRIDRMMEQCRIPQDERAAFSAFAKDNSGTIERLVFGVNNQLNNVAYYEAMAEKLPQLKDDNAAKTVKKFLADSYDDYRMIKHKISKVILQPEDNDTFLNFCDCEATGSALESMAHCVNNYRRSKNLDELNIKTVHMKFPKAEEATVSNAFDYHVLSAVDVKLNGEQYTMTMESTAPPSGKLFYQPDKNPQALGLYHSVDEIRQVYAEKENHTKQYSSAEKKATIQQLKSAKYKYEGKLFVDPDLPYNFSSFTKDPVFDAIRGGDPQEAPSAVDQQIHTLQEFSNRIADSQKAIWGSGSPQFKDLQHKVDECLTFMQQQKENNPLYLGTSESATAEKLGELSKYARAYLGIKQDEDGVKKSLNSNGEKRYALASDLKNFAEQFESGQHVAGVTPKNHAEGMKMLERFCAQMKNSEGMLKGQPSLEQAKFNDFSVAVMGLREIENMNAAKKLSSEVREKAVSRLIKRAEKYIDAEKIAAEKTGQGLSPESKIRIDIAEKLRGFATGFKNVLPKAAQNARNKPISNDLKNPKINPTL